MHSKFWTASVAMAVVAAAIGGAAQQAAPPAQGAAPAGRGGGRGNVGPGFFTAVDTDKDGAVTRAEMKATFERWFGPMGCRRHRRPDPGAAARRYGRGVAAAGSRRLWRWRRPWRARGAEPDAAAPARRGDDGGAARNRAGQAEAAAPRAGAGQGRRLRPLVDSPRWTHDRRAGQEDRRVDDHHHLRSRGHQRAEPQAVRRDLPRQHHRRVPGRSERRGRDRGPPQGAARLRPRREGARRHSRRDRFVSPERAEPRWRARGGRRRPHRRRAWRSRRRPRRRSGRRPRHAVPGAGGQEQRPEVEPRGVHRAVRRVVRQAGHRRRRPDQPGRLPAALRGACMPAPAPPAARGRWWQRSGSRRHSSVPTPRSAPGRSSTR